MNEDEKQAYKILRQKIVIETLYKLRVDYNFLLLLTNGDGDKAFDEAIKLSLKDLDLEDEDMLSKEG